jgi:hypothetical protein
MKAQHLGPLFLFASLAGSVAYACVDAHVSVLEQSTRFRTALKLISARLKDLREQEGDRLAPVLTELELLGADVRLFLSHRVDACKPQT